MDILLFPQTGPPGSCPAGRSYAERMDPHGPGGLAVLAGDIAGLFGALHRVEVARIPPTPVGWEDEPWSELRGDLAEVAGFARACLSPGLLARAEPYLAGRVAEPPQDGPRRFIHNDIWRPPTIPPASPNT
jgi:hypothetical protein